MDKFNKEKVIIESCEPSLEERERFFMDAEPKPVLPVVLSNEDAQEVIRGWFTAKRILLNDLMVNALTVSDKHAGQLKLEILEEVEYGIASALNRKKVR